MTVSAIISRKSVAFRRSVTGTLPLLAFAAALTWPVPLEAQTQQPSTTAADRQAAANAISKSRAAVDAARGKLRAAEQEADKAHANAEAQRAQLDSARGAADRAESRWTATE